MEVNEFNAFEKIQKYPDKMNYLFNRHKTLITIELDLTNNCDNKCPMCSGVKDKLAQLNFEQIKKLIDEFADEFDGKSVIVSGGGEPTIHPNFVEILYYIKNKGIKIGLNSNGYSLNEEKARAIIDCCSYFRISLDAGTPEMYKKTHGMDEDAFKKVIENMKMFAQIRKERGGNVSWGAGFLTGNHTKSDILSFIELSKECGVDFAQFRPFCYPTLDKTMINDDEMEKLRELYENENFKIRSSSHKYSRFDDEEKRPYNKCLGMFFSIVVTADFRVFTCPIMKQKENYCLGDLNKNTLKEIFTSPRIIEVFNSIDLKDCPYFCRNDDVNRGLHYASRKINHTEFL